MKRRVWTLFGRRGEGEEAPYFDRSPKTHLRGDAQPKALSPPLTPPKEMQFLGRRPHFSRIFSFFPRKIGAGMLSTLDPESVEFLLFFPRGVFLPLFPHILRCFKEEDFFREENFPSLGFKLRV